ncbi:type II toxin-antitoxin system HicA family toxin [Mitsuokella sp.]|uniref:type II toxin-antitoxin system HicA family toxin n=1 Tax=unclassified Mitsuokella TaxID=2637239 RepID=UPI003D7C77A5
MSKWEKLLLRLYSLPSDMQFQEIRKILIKIGYKENQPKGGSSHYTFRKQGCAPITIPAHNPIKKIYVEMVRNAVEREGDLK